MNDILLNILSIVVTAVILPLITLAGKKLIDYINAKTKDEKTRKLLTTTTDIVTNAVRSVFQTYVESLKKSGTFDKKAQEEALIRAKDIALNQMTVDSKNFITETYGNVDNWLTVQIESTINLMKNK